MPVTLLGATSGGITLQAPAVAGSNTLTLPASTGTLLTNLSGQTINTSIGINGSTSGTITLTVPAVAGTNTVTIAAQTGTLNAAGPAFHATAGGAQTVTNSVNTKITLTEDFDTNTDFSSSRFTPSVAGYYQINGAVWSNAGTSMNYAGALIYKNGSQYSLSYGASYTSTSANGIISDIVYLNGSTDYVELYGRVNGAGTLTINANTFFSGCLVRGA